MDFGRTEQEMNGGSSLWLADWFVEKERMEPLRAPEETGRKQVRQSRLLLPASDNQLVRTAVTRLM